MLPSESRCNHVVAVQATGCRWTGLTISKQQLQEASERVQAAGLSHRIELVFCDYRACQGKFDKVSAQPCCAMGPASTLDAVLAAMFPDLSYSETLNLFAADAWLSSAGEVLVHDLSDQPELQMLVMQLHSFC